MLEDGFDALGTSLQNWMNNIFLFPLIKIPNLSQKVIFPLIFTWWDNQWAGLVFFYHLLYFSFQEIMFMILKLSMVQEEPQSCCTLCRK